MNEYTRHMLEANSGHLLKIAREQREYIPLLTRSAQTAIEVWDYVQQNPNLSAREIGEDLNLHFSTVQEYLTVLNSPRGVRPNQRATGRPETIALPDN